MDVNLLRSLATLLMLGLFITIVAWALAAKRRAGFDEAAMLPFVEDTLDDPPIVLPAKPPAASSPGARHG